jgi:hypothetical protein
MTNERPKIRDKKEEMNDRWGSGDEREPADAKIQDLLFGDNARSPAELKTERMLDRLDRQLAMQEQAKAVVRFTWT